jgi:hypothetical protein
MGGRFGVAAIVFRVDCSKGQTVAPRKVVSPRRSPFQAAHLKNRGPLWTPQTKPAAPASLRIRAVRNHAAPPKRVKLSVASQRLAERYPDSRLDDGNLWSNTRAGLRVALIRNLAVVCAGCHRSNEVMAHTFVFLPPQ